MSINDYRSVSQFMNHIDLNSTVDTEGIMYQIN